MAVNINVAACLARARSLTDEADAASSYEAILLCDALADEWLQLARLITERERMRDRL